MSKAFENKVVLETGGTSGIGRSTAVEFARQGAVTTKPLPSRHRMAILSMIGAYPTIVLLLSIINPILADWPMPARAAILVPIMVVTLTYLVMPVLTKLAGSWKFASDKEKKPAHRFSRQMSWFAPLTVIALLILAQSTKHSPQGAMAQDTSRVAGTANASDALDGMVVDHVMINVSDFGRSVAWYQDKLGFKEVVHWTVEGLDEKHLAYLQRGDFLIEIASGPKSDVTAQLPRATDFASHFSQRGITHLCFKVHDVDTALDSLGKLNVPTFSPAIDFPPLDCRVGFIQDPDGNVIEFKGPLAGNNEIRGNAIWATK
jgi:catechol 2,3-dioxygenase-like lactoylglutathione lyase family enzyme